jgi:hypothetical protein
MSGGGHLIKLTLSPPTKDGTPDYVRRLYVMNVILSRNTPKKW